MSHIIDSTSEPPTHQPATAEMIGFSVLKPTVGMQRHSSGKLLVSAPPENASLPAPVMTAHFCVCDASNSTKAFCNNSAVSAQIALRFSGRLMVISVVPSALFSTRTFCIGFFLMFKLQTAPSFSDRGAGRNTLQKTL